VLTITRAAINVPAVTWRMLPGNVAHIKLSQFSEKADPEMQAALKAAKEAGAQKFVLDLRNNPGGLLDQAVKVTGQFLPKDAVVLRIRERGQTPEEAQELRSPVENPDTTTPMVVLINGGSASSSEIFASALQDHNRAAVIGVGTIGLGTVISPQKLDDGSAVYIGTAEWLTPNNRPLRHEGVTPDIEVALEGDDEALTPTTAKDLSDEEILNSTDKQLLKGLEALGVSADNGGVAAFFVR
jgi:carboxyl-terminal processing protease